MECRHRRSKRGPAHRPRRPSRKTDAIRNMAGRHSTPRRIRPKSAFRGRTIAFALNADTSTGLTDRPPRLRARQVIVEHDQRPTLARPDGTARLEPEEQTSGGGHAAGRRRRVLSAAWSNEPVRRHRRIRTAWAFPPDTGRGGGTRRTVVGDGTPPSRRGAWASIVRPGIGPDMVRPVRPLFLLEQVDDPFGPG